MKYYGIKTGLDVPSIKISGTGLLYGFKTEKEYDKSNYDECDFETFEFNYDVSAGTVLFTMDSDATVDQEEFLENLIDVLQQELDSKRNK